MKIVLIRLDQIDTVWPHVQEILARSLDKFAHEWTIIDLFHAVRNGSALLFVSDPVNTACVMMPSAWRGDGAVRIAAFGSNTGDNWPQAFEQIAQWAKGNGAEYIVFDGSKAWGRLIPDAKVVRTVHEVKL